MTEVEQSARRIVSPEEAQALADSYVERGLHYRLAHTVATEPDRTRAAVVNALGWARSASDEEVYERVMSLQNGASL